MLHSEFADNMDFSNNTNEYMETMNEKEIEGGAAKEPRKPIQVRDNSQKIYGVYIQSLLTMKVHLHITEIGKNIKQNLEKKIKMKTEGRCIAEGFIRPNSVRIVTYSSGTINTDMIEFETAFECMICLPVEGMLIECITKTITKAGIHAEVRDGETVPLTIFIARDHHNMDDSFINVKENEKIVAKVIGIRYELNDPYICVIARLQRNNAGISKDARNRGGGEMEEDD
jgi:DNA-directed RNA polymerase subunit E'/Rpb7